MVHALASNLLRIMEGWASEETDASRHEDAWKTQVCQAHSLRSKFNTSIKLISVLWTNINIFSTLMNCQDSKQIDLILLSSRLER